MADRRMYSQLSKNPTCPPNTVKVRLDLTLDYQFRMPLEHLHHSSSKIEQYSAYVVAGKLLTYNQLPLA